MNLGRLAACLGLIMAFGIAPLPSSAAPQGRGPLIRPSQRPLPDGQRIEAKDGDVVLVDDDARVRIVRRRQAVVRAIHNAEQRWVLLLADYVPPGGAPDGQVDMSFNFSELVGEWPLPARWEGLATLADYSVAGEIGTQGLGVTFPIGLVQFRPVVGTPLFRDDSAIAVLSFSGSGRGGGNQSFAAVEQNQVRVAEQNFERNRARPGMPPINVQTSLQVSGTASGAGGVVVTPPSGAAQPVRVGGNVGGPKKLVDVPPVYPEQARQAGIKGVVILELTIGADGSVTDAKVLRSIPLLDNAALAAARQWRYEPAMLNGNPVPVIMTATVQFP